jgi:hypothetical protein
LDAQDIEILGRLPGVSAEAVAEARERLARDVAPPPVCEVWDDNWEHFQLFRSMGNAWSKLTLVRTQAVVGLGVPVIVTDVRRDCLPPERVEAHLRLKGFPRSRWPAFMEDLEIMVDAVLLADAQQAQSEDA